MALADQLREAADHLREGRLGAARQVLVAALRENPSSDQGWYLLSFAVTERSQQIECLERVLRINPANERAQARLNSLRPSEPPPDRVPPFTQDPATASSAPESELSQRVGLRKVEPPQEQPVQPLRQQASRAAKARESKRPGWLRAAIVLGGVALAGALAFGAYGGFVLFSEMQAQNRQATEIAQAQTAIAFATSGESVALPPTWTPSVTPTTTLTPTATFPPTSTPTPTFPPPNPTIAAQMDAIEQEVADLRGLAIRSEVPRFLISKARVREVLEQSYLENGGTREEVADQARTLSALGLIKPTYDLFTNTLNGLSDNIGGFYFPWSKQTFVIGGRFSGIERWVYSHEFDHALVDQHFDIAGMGIYPVCLSNEDRCTAIRALIEGDATLLMTLWLVQYAGPQDYEDILRYNPPASTLPEQFPPPYAGPDSAFPYDQGTEFVVFLHDRGNWAEVNRAYARLPESTEQILHPQKYLAGEAPIDVPAPELGVALGGSWRRLYVDRLGEWKTYLLLRYGADLAAQLDDATAAAAAAGWGGDSVQVYYDDVADDTILIVHWAWDTTADAGAFHAAMLTYLQARFRAGAFDHPQGDCWSSNDQVSCVFEAARETLWLLAPDRGLLDLVFDQYPTFR